jgi:protein-L-isoaspartate O-methyltransferase
LINQLKTGGRMPVDLPEAQQLVVAEKDLNNRVRTGNYAGTVLAD